MSAVVAFGWWQAQEQKKFQNRQKILRAACFSQCLPLPHPLLRATCWAVKHRFFLLKEFVSFFFFFHQKKGILALLRLLFLKYVLHCIQWCLIIWHDCVAQWKAQQPLLGGRVKSLGMMWEQTVAHFHISAHITCKPLVTHLSTTAIILTHLRKKIICYLMWLSFLACTLLNLCFFLSFSLNRSYILQKIKIVTDWFKIYRNDFAEKK